MPPSTTDLVRAKITRLLNGTPAVTLGRQPRKQVAYDHGTRIVYTAGGRTFEITVREIEDK